MRPWASRTAKTAVLTLAAGLAATAGGLSGVALAASGTSQVTASAGMPDDACDDAGALLGLAGAACLSVALPGAPAAAAAPAGRSAAVSQVVQRAVAPVTAVLGAGPVPVLKTALAPVTAVLGDRPSLAAGAGGASAPRTDGATPDTPATRAGDTNVPAATQLAGLGALPGLADLPSPAGPAGTSVRNGPPGGGATLPRTALSSANSGMSSVSIAVLVAGALLAGVSALKILSRRTRDAR